ncbi:recombinase XerD [Sphingobium sp.]|uniref:recombinase XerD n=1 Tax=Sphingobium sp. TaxID=1912891 RepID=UPI002CDC2508|nr:recombinase XerD [Sphingobium sp.]HUD91607.1 recombinase XerD [Sphingobium sp.]
MGWLVKHIQNHPGGRKSFRRQFPNHLRPYLSGTQLRVSLGHPDAPDFLKRYDAAASQYDREVAQATRKHSGQFNELTPELSKYLCETWISEGLALDEDVRWVNRPSWRKREARANLIADIKAELEEALVLRALGDIEAIVTLWGPEAEGHAEVLGFLLDKNAPEFSDYVRAFHNAQIETWQAILKRLDGKDVPTPVEPEAPRRKSAEAQQPVFLMPTFEAYAKAQGVSAGVSKEWRNYIQSLIGFLGHDDARRLTRDDLTNWRDHLLATPGRQGKLRKPVTVRDKYVTAVRCTLAWATEEKLLPENVAAGLKVRIPKEAVTRDKDFTGDEALAILRASLEAPKGRLSQPYVRARRWIPWLCAYSGARVNELSQLRKQDVVEVEGVWVMRITPEAGTVKTRVAREVPLHPHLIEQGFLAVVKALKAGPIFYDPSKLRATGENAEGNRHVKKVGERLAAWVRTEVGIIDPAIKPNHAWRHLFKTMSADVGMEERVADAIQGHAATTTGRKYGKVSVQAKAAAIERLPRFKV